MTDSSPTSRAEKTKSRAEKTETLVDGIGDASPEPFLRSPMGKVAGLLFALAVAAIGILAFTGGGDDVVSPVPEFDTVTFDGDLLPNFVPGEEDPAVGTKAPVVTATSLGNGTPVSLTEGRARVIGFFAHWCPHCQAELPELTGWLADNELPPNTDFIAVSTLVRPREDNYPPSAWFEAENFTSPVLLDDQVGTMLNGFGFTGFPAFVAIDASGTVVARAGGNIGVDGFEELLANFAS